jgi:small subunit ribosomal protein S5
MNTKVKKTFSRERGSGTDGASATDALIEKVVHVGRCSKVVSGGRRFSFSALVVVGNKKGKVGVGYGRAHEVADAVRKAGGRARNHMVDFTLKGSTIPHDVIGHADGGVVLIKPATRGTGLIAGGGIRAVLEVAGIEDA